MRLLKFILSVAPFLLHGCAHFYCPVCRVPSCYIETPQETPIECSYALCQWWEQFNDPQLVSLVQEAIACNYDFRIALEKICVSRGCYQQEFGRLLPQLDLDFSVTRTRNSETLANSEFLGATFVNYFLAGFDAFWEIDLFGKNWNAKEAALFDFFQSREHARDVLITLISEVAESYITLLAIVDLQKIALSHIENEKQLVMVTDARYEGGLTDAVDALRAKALLDEKESAYHQLEHLKKAEIFRIGTLLGRPPEEVACSFQHLPSLPLVEGIIPLGLPSDLLCRRPDIRQAEYKLHAAGARLLEAQKQLLPTISLTATFEWLTRSLPLLFKPDSRNWMGGPAGLTMPIFEGGILRGNIIVKNARQRSAALNYERAFIFALQEVETTMTTYVEEMKKVFYLKDEVASNKEARELAEILYFNGVGDFKLVIDIERDLFDAEIRLAESKRNAMANLIALYKALGGGWECIDLQ